MCLCAGSTRNMTHLSYLDDRHNQVVTQSEMLRFETYVVEDDSDYDSMPVVPPNDEYVSEDELQPSCTDSDSGSDSRS
ncbi:hypothetical protein F2Q69_00020352 [Brassica cretica]|uniref:Uncharacterized protein n=1 Tax=Brassica cretica TaxID=69181 RepID=A0A8S9Q5Q7_BRACR|nr:hypothetical protein F2Q69_00020352 [Brassica cretica]